MSFQFRALCTLEITHAYVGGVSQEVGFVIPSETAASLRRARMLARVSGGVLHLMYESDDAGRPRVSAAGTTLRFGLSPQTASFRNVTAPSSLPPVGIGFWRNTTAASNLDAMQPRALVGRVFSHQLADAARPVIVSVLDDRARTLRSETVSAAQNASSVAFDLSGLDPGPLTITEAYPAGEPRTTSLLVHAELAREQLIGVVELTIAEALYVSANPIRFEVAFTARSEHLCYYLVVTNHNDAELAKISVADAGFGEDHRAKIEFDRVAGDAFGAAELPTALLGGDAGARFLLFRSVDVVARRERPRRKIQLSRNGEVLVEHLPQPRPEQGDSNLVIHLSKAR
jgi:hypothetical protein